MVDLLFNTFSNTNNILKIHGLIAYKIFIEHNMEHNIAKTYDQAYFLTLSSLTQKVLI